MSITKTELRLSFFDYLFGEREGFICIAHAPKQTKNAFDQKFFKWPSQREGMGAYIEDMSRNNNVWFGVNQFRLPKRSRDYAIPTNLLWSDLDYCNPAKIEPAPQCRIQSSPNRFQAIWRLDETIDPLEAQRLSKRIAYAYADEGADKSGWDVEQLLRVPFTFNYKYDDGQTMVPEVELLSYFEVLLPVAVFEEVTPKSPGEDIEQEIATTDPMPDVMKLPHVPTLVNAYRDTLKKTNFDDLFVLEPEGDWSSVMWRLLNTCLECGMDREETFAVALESACNKYKRDDRPIAYLWKEVVKADYKQKQIALIEGAGNPLVMPVLFNGDEPDSIITTYKDWAVKATDAVVPYHELSCTMLLSALLAGGIYSDTSFGRVHPNLWGLVLGESTLTRKTTAMKMAMSFLYDINRELIVASEGSAEGLLTALADRPSQVSVFFKDEIAGMLDSMERKNYLAGMPETLAHLYDVPDYYPRTLRKETIVVTKPIFIFFGGGIRDKTYSLLNDTHVLSGFLPRFLIVGGEADIEKIRPTGPAAPDLTEQRRKLLELFQDLHLSYNEDNTIEVAGGAGSLSIPVTNEAVLTDGAWEYYRKIEMQLARQAEDSIIPATAHPTFGRLAWSTFKMAMLFAAARQRPIDNKIIVQLDDFHAAAYYVQQWGKFTIDLIQNVGTTVNQRLTARVLEYVTKRGQSTRSEISRAYHLDKRELSLILETLLDRGQIRMVKQGNSYAIYPL